MLTLKKMMTILNEKDRDKQAALIDALSDSDKAKLAETVESLKADGAKLAELGKKLREGK